jgi:hypothetical protein
MSPICTTLELLHAKDSYNRISLQSTWSRNGRSDQNLKYDRLSLNYGDSRIQYLNEKRKCLCEGLKICK